MEIEDKIASCGWFMRLITARNYFLRNHPWLPQALTFYHSSTKPQPLNDSQIMVELGLSLNVLSFNPA